MELRGTSMAPPPEFAGKPPSFPGFPVDSRRWMLRGKGEQSVKDKKS
jgi:hypothetical protein